MKVNRLCKPESMQMLVHVLTIAESYDDMHEKIASIMWANKIKC